MFCATKQRSVIRLCPPLVEIRRRVVFSQRQPLDLARGRLYYLIHFYIYKLHKTLEDNRICLMFTKGNMAVGEMNGGSTLSTPSIALRTGMLKTGSLTIYGRRRTDDRRRMLDAIRLR
jgi:hypothetical protein